MSVQELRSRIVQLDSDIELQKKVLEKLEKDRAVVKRQLNAALDPVARLPFEISSEIFLQSLPPSPSEAPRSGPVVLLGICNAWNAVALATPALWTTVRIRFPCGDDVAEVLPIWFGRARGRPISISICLCGSFSNWNHRVSDVVWRHGGQLKHLEILDSDDLAANGFAPDDQDQILDLFGDTTSVSLPLLQTLTLRCQHRRDYRDSQIFQLLRGAPNIVEFILDKVWFSTNFQPQSVVVPTLRRLIFGEGDDEIFFHLGLPALEALSLPMYYLSGDQLVARVKRLVAPLQDLALGWEFHRINSLQLHDCLRLIPSLTRFRMSQPDANVVTELFTALAEFPSLLPNLHDLTIHILDTARTPSNISNFSWRTLLRALSTRRMDRLHIVPVRACPRPGVLASLRELVANGAHIHIGIENLNFLVA
ncbi:hypothetical protein C8R45DRAFT_873039 [Mycena sanguinolenta]|nr:hypothetical protein C8R45DRAFT_873039 [Mycena sanguinolenta]